MIKNYKIYKDIDFYIFILNFGLVIYLLIIELNFPNLHINTFLAGAIFTKLIYKIEKQQKVTI